MDHNPIRVRNKKTATKHDALRDLCPAYCGPKAITQCANSFLDSRKRAVWLASGLMISNAFDQFTTRIPKALGHLSRPHGLLCFCGCDCIVVNRCSQKLVSLFCMGENFRDYTEFFFWRTTLACDGWCLYLGIWGVRIKIQQLLMFVINFIASYASYRILWVSSVVNVWPLSLNV